MSKKRMIDTKFWADNYIVELDPLERYLFLYFLTNEHTNLAGIYELSLRMMAFETGLDGEMLDKILKRFKGKVHHINGWVYVKNFAKHQIFNESVKRGIEKAIQDIPSDILAKIKDIDTECQQSGDKVGSVCEVFNLIESNLTKSNLIESKVIKPEALKLAKLLYQLIKDNNPSWYIKPNWEKWAEDIDKLMRLDNRNYEQIEWMIRWTQQDDFWSQNILSPAKLRKQFNNLVVKAKGKQKKVLEIKR